MISINNATVRFNGEALFSNISFMINEKDRIGLIGKNGAGKTTLMQLLAGELQPEEGDMGIPKDMTIGYLPQHIEIRDNWNIYEETKTAFSELTALEKQIQSLNNQIENRDDYESDEYMKLINDLTQATERYNLLGGGAVDQNIEQTLKGLGFRREDLSRPTSEFSGGWRMRIELAKILLQYPDLLLLDEPINHLDIEAIQWFEQFIKNYPGTVIIIAHDQDFLDNVTNRTVELSINGMYDFELPYSDFIAKKEEIKEQQIAAKENQEKKIEQTQRFIDRFRYKANKASLVQSRIKQLDKMERIEVDEEDNARINVDFPPAPRSGKVVAEIENCSKWYDDLHVLDNVDLTIERGEKLAFVGKNGEGKSTLVKIINNEISYEGKCNLGYNVKIGYFAQDEPQKLPDEKTVFEVVEDVATDEVRNKLRDILGAFLFSGDDIDKKVKVLSGGERTRLALARLLLEPYSLIIMDEPTKHLDIRSKEVLKQALLNYDGTLILVSHDRHFLDGLIDKIYEFKNKNLKEHIGGIYEFIKKINAEIIQDISKKKESKKHEKQEKKAKLDKTDVSNKQLYEQRKNLDKEIRKLDNTIKNVEREIDRCEKELGRLDGILADPPEDKEKMNELINKYQDVKQTMENQMEEWEKNNQVLEQKKAQRENLF